ncbi:hypothetical protein D3C71_1559280 [compost metagenome]
MDGGDVEFHHLDLGVHGPGAQFEHAAVGGGCIVETERDSGQHRRFGERGRRLHAGVLVVLVGVDDDVHVALAV